MLALLKFFALSVKRDRLLISLFLLIFISSAFSIFFGGNAIAEQTQMIVAYIASSSRIIINLGMIVFIITHITRLFYNKEIDFVLSKPISRKSIICAYTLGISLLSLLIALIPTALLIAFGSLIQNTFVWFISFTFEIVITTTFAFLTSLFFRSQVSAILASFTFYIGARMMGFFYMSARYDYIYTGIDSLSKWLPQKIMYITSVVLPRFDLYTQTNWLLYEIKSYENIKFIAVQAVMYIIILHFAAFYDIEKKEF